MQLFSDEQWAEIKAASSVIERKQDARIQNLFGNTHPQDAPRADGMWTVVFPSRAEGEAFACLSPHVARMVKLLEHQALEIGDLKKMLAGDVRRLHEIVGEG